MNTSIGHSVIPVEFDIYTRDGTLSVEGVFSSVERGMEFLDFYGLVLLKPDAIARGKMGEALTWLQMNRLAVVAQLEISVNEHMASALWWYHWKEAPLLRVRLVQKLMGQGPSTMLIVKGRTAGTAQRVAALKGPSYAEDQVPGQMRYELKATNRILNLVHMADSTADLVRELAILLSPKDRGTLLQALACNRHQDSIAAPLSAQSANQAPMWADRPSSNIGLTQKFENAILKRADEPAIQTLLSHFRVPSRRRLWWQLKRDAEAAGLPWCHWDTLLLASPYSEDLAANAHLDCLF